MVWEVEGGPQGGELVYANNVGGGFSQPVTAVGYDPKDISKDWDAKLDAGGHCHLVYTAQWDMGRVYYTHNSGGTFSDPVMIAEGSDAFTRPQLLFDPSGNDHIVWLGANFDDPDNPYWTAGYSSDLGGGAFSSPVAVVTSGNQIAEFSFDVSSSGNIYLAWQERYVAGDPPFTYKDIWYADNTAGSFSVPLRLSNQAAGSNKRVASFSPQVVVDSDGYAHVGWIENNYTLLLGWLPGNPPPRVLYNHNRGGSFLVAPEQVSNSGSVDECGSYRMLLTGEGRIYVFWVQHYTLLLLPWETSSYSWKEVDGGWQGRHDLNRFGLFDLGTYDVDIHAGVSCAENPTGGVYVAWTQDPANQDKEVRYNPGDANTYTPSSLLHPSDYNEVQPCLAYSGAALYAEWLVEQPNRMDISLARLEGMACGPPTMANPTMQVTGGPAAALGNRGILHAAWQGEQWGESGLYYVEAPRDDTAEPVHVGGVTGEALPSLTLGPDSLPRLTWQSEDGGDREIYYSDDPNQPTSTQAVTSNAEDDIQPDLAVDGDGVPHICWLQGALRPAGSGLHRLLDGYTDKGGSAVGRFLR